MTNYEHSEYPEFLYDIVDIPNKAKAEFEKQVDRVIASASLDEMVGNHDETYYLTLASLAGHGVGLWEGREPWHLTLEAAVKQDAPLHNAFHLLEDEVQHIKDERAMNDSGVDHD